MDEIDTFEGWLKAIQGIDPAIAPPEQVEVFRPIYEEIRKNPTPKVGLRKLKPLRPGEYRYAVAIRENADLWLTLWVARSPHGDVYIAHGNNRARHDRAQWFRH